MASNVIRARKLPIVWVNDCVVTDTSTASRNVTVRVIVLRNAHHL
jgi:hypothetical protein